MVPRTPHKETSKGEPQEQREKELGDEHRYGFEDDPAADDKVDNRTVVRTREKDGSFHVGTEQEAAGTPVERSVDKPRP
jgi:hypothetical protein